MYFRMNYANPTKSDIDRSHAEISCYGRDAGREFLKKEITNAYEQGVNDTKSKFYDQVKDLFTSHEFVDIFNSNRKNKAEKSYTEQSSQLCLLETAKRNWQAGSTSVAIGMILAYLVNEHGK